MFNAITSLWSGPAWLGEGPLWHPIEQKLYWIDIAKSTVHRLDIYNHNYQEWSVPGNIGTVVPCHQGGVIITIANELASIDFSTGKLTKITTIFPATRNDLRTNDGRCDRLGRLWIGVTDIALKNPLGGLYKLDLDGRITQMEAGITISNGMGWSPDNKIFYFTDSFKNCIYQYDFDLNHGTITNRRIFLQFTSTNSVPDGLTIDSAGYLWIVFWNGKKIARYAPDGRLDLEIKLPVLRPTSCILGGKNYQTLYITTCSKTRDEPHTLPSPAGAIFAIDVATKGLPETPYKD